MPQSPPTTPGPLHGLVVADFSRVLAGPLASMFLADLGATVVKVERPGTGDDTRAWGPPYVGPMSTYFTSVNRNKYSVVLDLDDPADLALARELVCRADVMLENFRPGKFADFGLDWPTVSRLNRSLVYCSISGFGAGAGADRPGYDFVVQAVGGLMSITGQPGGQPTKVGVALVDVLAGLHTTIGILSALRERDRSGRGQLVEVNLLSSLLASTVNQGAAYLNDGSVPVAMGNQHPSIAPYETLSTKDRPLAVAVGNDRQFRALTRVLSRPDMADDPRFSTNRARVEHRPQLIAELEAALRDETAQTWSQRLHRAGIPCGAVNDLAEAFTLATQLGLDPITYFDADQDTPAIATLTNPVRLSASPVQYRRRPPSLGADSTAVRRWLTAHENLP